MKLFFNKAKKTTESVFTIEWHIERLKKRVEFKNSQVSRLSMATRRAQIMFNGIHRAMNTTEGVAK